MSLHALANNMAAQGRGPDSTLVHMSPREVHGLQALAMANGGTLTINPQTGLPEAGFLDSLLPALAGFALNAFLPGVGGAIGGALGLGAEAASTVGTGLLVGGATGLATGSLEKGLMAGLGAYGGAGLESGLNAAGKTALETASSAGAGRGAFLPGAEVAPSSTLDRLQAGLGAYSKAPYDALKDNAMNFGLAASPLLSGTFDDQQTSGGLKRNPGNILIYKKDPVTGKSYVDQSIPGDQAYRAPGMVWGNANGGMIKHYDDGGVTDGAITNDAIKKGIVWGNVPNPDLTGHDMNDTRSDSQKAQDYLTGKSKINPFLFYSKQVDPIAKAAEATKTLQQEIKEDQKRYGGGNPADRAAAMGSSEGGFPAGLAPAANTVAQALGDMGLNSLSHAVSNAAMSGAMSGSGAAPQSSPTPSIGADNGLNPGWGSRDAGMGTGVAPSSGNDGLGGINGVTGVSAGVGEKGRTGMGTGTGTGEAHDSENSATGERDHDPGSSEARGGLNLHGRYYPPHYADGGITGGGNIDLHVPINIGGGQGGMGGGISSLGSLGNGNGIQQGGMSRPSSNFLQQQQQGLPGYQAVQKAQQDYNNSDEYKNFQQYAQQYQQSLGGGQSGIFGGMMGGARGGLGPQNNMLMPLGGQNGLYGGTPMSKPSYEQYLAGRSPYQQDLQLSREQYENPQGSSGPGGGMADGGITALAGGGHSFFSQRTGKYQEHTPQIYAEGGATSPYNLGSYSDGGRLLRGPGDGVSDDIPATIGENQPARLADGEFVVPARIVSELGNGSTEAGARKLYAMMDRVQKSRSKTVGKDKVAANTRADKYLPA